METDGRGEVRLDHLKGCIPVLPFGGINLTSPKRFIKRTASHQSVLRKQTFLGLLLSTTLLYFVLSSIDLKTLQPNIIEFGVGYFFLFGLINISAFFVRAVKWQIVATPIVQMGTLESVRILFVSYFVNSFFPAQIGGLVRAYLLEVKRGVRFAFAFATVLIDRMLDGVTMIALLIIAEFFAKSQLHLVHEVLEVASVLLALSLAFILSPAKRLQRLAGPLESLPSGWWRGLSSILKGFTLSGQAFSTYPSNAILFISSFAAWLLEALFFYLVIRRVGIDINFPAAVVVLLVLNIGLLLPAAPGYIGTYEAFVFLGLLSFGAAKTEAAAVALIAHSIQYISMALFGIIALKTMDLDWRELFKFEKRKSLD
jgi:hypothetical protein